MSGCLSQHVVREDRYSCTAVRTVLQLRRRLHLLRTYAL